MLLQGVDIGAGEQRDRVRVRGRVRYDGDGLEEDIWFDLPVSHLPHLSDSGNPWLVALLPIAISLGEPLRLATSVDPRLLEGCWLLQEVWCAWYPHLTPITIEAPNLRSAPRTGPDRTGLFFSGGVDSFHSLIRHNGPGPTGAPAPVTDLLLIHGADIPIADGDAFNRLRPRMADVAGSFGVGLVEIATNIRETRWGRADWPQLSHAALLAAAGLLLEPRFARLLIASSASLDRLRPWGSHPISDPLFSTSNTRVIHDGAQVDRPAKVLSIGAHPAVLKHLRICWIGRTDSNCGRCPKCLLTMVGLELAGALDKCETLPRKIDRTLFRSLYLESQGTYTAYWVARSYRQLALMANRSDLVALLDDVLGRSDRLGLSRDMLEGLERRRLLPSNLSKRLIARLFRSTVKY